MSWEAIFAGLTLVYFIGGGVISYWVNSISKSQDNLGKNQTILAKDLKNLEVMLPNDYVKKADLDYRLSRIEHILDQIMTKLDTKMDKI